MSAAVLSAAKKLDLSSITKNDEKLGLVKETSTVGDLISFTDRRVSPVRQVHRRRGSTGTADFANFRRKSLQRSDSENSVNQRSRKSSVSVAWGSENVSPDLDTSRQRSSRRNSMMNALREDLGKLPCLTAVKKRRNSSKQSIVENDDYDDPFNPSDSDDDRISPYRRKSTRRSSNMIRIESRMSSSSESTSGILTETEKRKLKMLQTLSTMNGDNKCKYKRNNSIDSQGEIAILEASYGRGKKRGSIATHVLMKTRHKKGPLTELKTNKSEVILGSPSPQGKTENEILTEEQRDRSLKMFQVLKKNEKPKLIGLVGKSKDSITKEDVAKETFLGFRRRLKRKRVRIYQF